MKKETAYCNVTNHILGNLDNEILWQKTWDANRHPMNGVTGPIANWLLSQLLL